MTDHCSQLIDYFNRTLTSEETAAFEQHLTECPSCQAELDELLALTEGLPYLADEVEVPRDLKSKVFASLDDGDASSPWPYQIPAARSVKTEKRRGPAVPVLAAALVASLMTNAYLATVDSGERADITEQAWEVAGKASLAPQEEGVTSAATAFILTNGSDQELVVDAENLPALAEEQLYQVWVLKDGAPQPAGAFRSPEGGRGSVTHSLGTEAMAFDTVAITIETEEGLPAPKGPIILAGSL